MLRDPFSFILPRSKRLITQGGMSGDNTDVLPPDENARGGGFGFAGGRSSDAGDHEENVTGIELTESNCSLTL